MYLLGCLDVWRWDADSKVGEIAPRAPSQGGGAVTYIKQKYPGKGTSWGQRLFRAGGQGFIEEFGLPKISSSKIAVAWCWPRKDDTSARVPSVA